MLEAIAHQRAKQLPPGAKVEYRILIMPRPTPKPSKPTLQSHPPEVVDPIWLMKAIGFTILAAVICGYFTFCLLFYQGQWQLVLHPTRTSSSPSSISGIPYENIHFGPDESAVPQLTGWWIPAASDAPYTTATILFLPGSDDSLTNSISTLANLHHLGINIFAFDYRGYGQSASTHPNQQTMTQDTESAWRYLTISRAIPSGKIIPYGINIGSSLAVHLAVLHPAIPGVILDSPYADLLDIVQNDSRSRFLPLRLLFHERFPLAQPLSTLPTPKLLISRSTTPEKAFQTAADPKMIVETPFPSDAYNQSLTRFLNQYLQLTPHP
jgi:hypothetical protein